MQSIGIETAQNVVVHQEVASVGDRILSHMLDVAIKWAYVIIAEQILPASFGFDFDSDAQVISTLVIGIPFTFYHLVSELVMNGQTIGKRVLKVKVARVDGTEPGFGQYLLRWLFRIVDVWLYGFGLVIILFNGKGQRLGDIVAGTVVVTLKRRVSLDQTLMTHVPAGHQVRFPEVIRLTDAQAVMIKEVLNTRKVKDQYVIIDEMAVKVRKVIGNDGAGLNAKDFLETVLRDYVHITGQQTTK